MVRINRRTCNVRERTVRKYSECNATPLSKCKEALKIMSKCNNTFYGLVKGGVYVYAPAGSKK